MKSVPSDADCSGRRIGPLWRLAATTVLVASALSLYFIITLTQTGPVTQVVMPSWVPFWPVFALPYLSLLAIAWVLPVAIRDEWRFLGCLLGMTAAFAMVAPLWIFIPTRIDRPPLPDDWWATPYLWIAAVDPPHCVMPCAHGIGPTVAAWFVGSERPTWRWPLLLMLVIGLPSIVFVGQHRPIDLLIGSVAAAIGIAIGEESIRRERARCVVANETERPAA